ncbi:FMN-binding protein [Microbacterium sp. B2969]|uniref:FMN-binding protein n=1 Tax=Microbacterium alkaliflavum TaxID=3248839 RepID=A0ABW7Q5R4_9MICO
MRKIVFGILATIAGLVALFSYRTSLDASPATIPATGGQTPGSSSGSGTLKDGTFDGGSVNTRYGPVDVKITVSGGKITAVDVPVYPDGNGTDRRINSFAIPRLVSETLSAQSSHLDMVSGATFTSNGYVQSLQSALDRAGQ